MSLGALLKKRWKLLLNIATIAALVIVIYAIRHELVTTISNLAHVHAWILLLLIPIELLDYHAQARLYQRLFGIVGNHLPYKFLYKISLELNFVNHVFPSGGVTGISYFGVRMSRENDISGGKATLIQVMKLALTFLSFEVLIVFGLFCLAIMGRVNNLTILVGGSLSTLLVVGTAAFVYIVGSKERIDNFLNGATRIINQFIHLIRRNHPESINVLRAKAVFDDFHSSYEQLKDRRQELWAPFFYALLANVAELLAVYAVYMAFGKFVNIGAVILAYAVANFAGLVSVLPGGVGIYEGLMTAVLVAAGVPARVSIPVTIMYRVLNTLIQLPPGYILYHHTLNYRRAALEKADGSSHS